MEAIIMQKKKKGLWLFISSLIPGAGEMYMGFKKQGISIMLLFFTLFALGMFTGLDFIIWLTPIVWFYSFYNVHNLKSLPDEEFYSIEDNYVLHLDEFTGDITGLLKKHHTVAAGLLILFGISILWRGISDIFYWFLPGPLAGIINNLGYSLPQIIIGAFILIAGIYLLNNKRQSFNQYEDSYTQEEHYWEPYRPYQQQGTPNPAPSCPAAPAETYAQQETPKPVPPAPHEAPAPAAAPMEESAASAPETTEEYPPYPDMSSDK